MKIAHIIRYGILLAFLALFTVFSLRHFVLGGDVAASVDALCPFGGIETLLVFITTGGFVPRILMSSLILSIGVFLTVLFFKRGFCGWICPFGTIQELLGLITKKKKLPAFDRPARYLKYILLIAILLLTTYTGYLVFRDYDPFLTFFHFGKGIFWDFEPDAIITHTIAFAITITVLIASVFISRVWCKYLCPLGAGMAIFSRFGLTSIVRDSKNCNKCKRCDKVCPVGVKVSNVKKIKDTECIDCKICVDECPKKVLKNQFFGYNIPSWLYGLFVVAVLFATIFISIDMGSWQSIPDGDLVTEDGTIDLASIKGWMTLNQLSNGTQIPTTVFYEGLSIPLEVDPETPIKDLSQKYGLSIHAEDIRTFIETLPEEKSITCPWGIEDDDAPGLCGLYVDSDNNNICDFSE
ncbi:4Fe-4S binding protein [Candidatus Woesearchaeota archaeon]|nr:4Fe-4S binding protein [Candidatus Woesearchaeota archaeon]